MLENHGIVEFEWQGSILTLQVQGPFNLGGANKFYFDFIEQLKNKPESPWQRLDILDSETLGSPEVIALVEQSYVDSHANGCPKIAVVVSNSLQAAIFERSAQNKSLNLKIFTQVNDAKQWLTGQD